MSVPFLYSGMVAQNKGIPTRIEAKTNGLFKPGAAEEGFPATPTLRERAGKPSASARRLFSLVRRAEHIQLVLAARLNNEQWMDKRTDNSSSNWRVALSIVRGSSPGDRQQAGGHQVQVDNGPRLTPRKPSG
jgi:hypothetical protein